VRGTKGCKKGKLSVALSTQECVTNIISIQHSTKSVKILRFTVYFHDDDVDDYDDGCCCYYCCKLLFSQAFFFLVLLTNINIFQGENFGTNKVYFAFAKIMKAIWCRLRAQKLVV
jgi:hypothetical protein